MASPMIDVYVKVPSGKATCSHYLPHDTVAKIAETVAKDEGIPSKLVRLKYQGKILKKNQSISYLGICAETILKAEFLVPKDINLYVNFPDGRCEPVPTKNTNNVSDLKLQIQAQEDIPSRKQKIKLDGRLLAPESDMLCDLGVGNESVLTVVISDEHTTKSAEEDPKANQTQEELANEEATREELLSSFNTNGGTVDVVFSFDTTGSMYSYLDKIRRKLRESCEKLIRDIPNIRIGIIAHGDYCDYSTYVIRYVDLTSDTDTLIDFTRDVPSTGGGDSPEAYEWMLRVAQKLDWSENSAKALVVIGDCEPHPPSYTDQNVYWQTELDVLKGMDVKVYGVQAYSNNAAKPFYEELAERTGGYYLQLKHLDLITDMFLAVCYREANQEQLEAFVEEVENEGRMTEEKKQIFKELEKKKEPLHAVAQAQRYVREAWWDPSLDTSTRPSYTYNESKDSWSPYTATSKGGSSAIGTGPSLGTCSRETPRYHTIINSKPKKKRSMLRKMLCMA